MEALFDGSKGIPSFGRVPRSDRRRAQTMKKLYLLERFFGSKPTMKVGTMAWYSPGAVPRK